MNAKKWTLWAWGLLLMPVLGIGFVWFTKESVVQKKPNFGTLPTFELTERSGESINLEQLKGKTWIANFVFTRCSGQCPILNQKMQTLLKQFHNEPLFRAVSISVEPDYDTTSVLQNYAKRFETDGKWLFLTGARQKIQTLIEKGFKVVSGINQAKEGMIAHTSKFVLINRYGNIEGYYDVLEDETAMARLAKDARRAILRRF